MAPWGFKTVRFLCVAIILVWLITAAPRSTEARSTAAPNEQLTRKLKDFGESASEDPKLKHLPSADSCDVDGHDLAHKFTELSSKLDLVGSDGEPCSAEEHHVTKRKGEVGGQNITTSSCDAIYGFIEQLLVDLDVTEYCCLNPEDAITCTNNGTTHLAKAYGYGFLMVFGVSLLSLLGLFLLPFITKNSKLAGLYEYISTLLIALGTSAVFSGAIFHLLPRVLGLEDNKDGYLYKAAVITVGLYVLYLFEVALHYCNAHPHHHGHHQPGEGSEPTPPHGPCRDSSSSKLGDPRAAAATQPPTCTKNGDANSEKCDETSRLVVKPKGSRTWCSFFRDIRPLAWIIIAGDAVHNFADGLTLGAAISQSLSLGLSTTIAIVLHEVPHELGNYAILLSSGLSWYAALLLNFFSSLTAIVGFFVGVTIGTESEESNQWILTIAVGLFLYVALVDLLPELIHSNKKGCKRILHIVMANIGFFVSFTILLLIAIYEDNLNSVFE